MAIGLFYSDIFAYLLTSGVEFLKRIASDFGLMVLCWLLTWLLECYFFIGSLMQGGVPLPLKFVVLVIPRL
jgi:hypothetical protein